MSFVEVFPTEPVIATTRASLRARTALPSAASAAWASSGTSVAAAPRARASSRNASPPETATNRSPGRSRRESTLTPVTVSASLSSRPSESSRTSASGKRDQPPPPSASFAASRSSNGTVRSANSWPCSAPLPAMRTTSPGCASSTARPIAAARSSSTSTSPSAPRHDLGDDRLGILAARVVGGDDRDVGELGGELAHQRPLAAVAVAAGTDDDDDAVPVRELARRAQHLLERVGLVRVVDDDVERLAGVDRLEAAGHAAHRLEAAAGSRRQRCRARAPRARPRARSRR